MRRRDFIAGFSGLASFPMVARAQPNEQGRRIGWSIGGEEAPI
jgi:hypothetical protein